MGDALHTREQYLRQTACTDSGDVLIPRMGARCTRAEESLCQEGTERLNNFLVCKEVCCLQARPLWSVFCACPGTGTVSYCSL